MSARLDHLRRGSGRRHGLTATATPIPRGASDPALVYHASVADEPNASDLRSAGGGVGRSAEAAETAALAEALERYAASAVSLKTVELSEDATDHLGTPVIGLDQWTLHSDEQREDARFPYRDGYPTTVAYTFAHDVATNTSVLVPATLVALRRDYGALATSSGLAADFAPLKALLRAVQELVERDAYVTTWVHGLPGRPQPSESLNAEVAAIGGSVRVYDLTPDYSPHPVACVAGTLPLRGRARNSLGLACRADWNSAVEKAYLEFVQGTMFAGHQLANRPELFGLTPETCVGFDEHAIYWSAREDRWWDLPLHAGGAPSTRSFDAGPASDVDQLTALVAALSARRIRLYYRVIPAAGLDQLGLRVVRAMSPDLVPLHHNHNWPFLGGTAPHREHRYPDLEPLTAYPSPYPHALG